MDTRRIILSLLLLSAFSPTSAQMYKWVDERGNVSFSDRPQPGKKVEIIELNKKQTPASNSARKSNKKATLKPVNKSASAALPKRLNGNTKINMNELVTFEMNLANYDEVINSTTVTVRNALLGRRFKNLNSILEQYNSDFETDVQKEETLFDAYAVFSDSEDRYPSLFNEWIKISPDRYQPYMARAIYNYSMGFDSRGTKWASETSKEEFTAMNDYFKKASDDLKEVLKIKPKFMPAYYYLILMMKTAADHENMYKILLQATSINPGSYFVRDAFLGALTPRWGGSYEAMAKYIAECRQYEYLNPNIKLLETKIYLDMGSMMSISKQYNKADEYYAKALSIKERSYAYYMRARNNYKRKEYEKALTDLNRAIESVKDGGEYYRWRAKTYNALGEYEKAVGDIILARKLDPSSEYVESTIERLVSNLERKGFDEARLRNYDAAIHYYSLGLMLDPYSPWLYYRRGKAYSDLGIYKSALADVERAISLNQDEYDFVLLIDWVLSRDDRWDDILPYWGRYIERHPDDSKAYTQRGGTHLHNNGLGYALKDFKKSAAMGDPDGARLYEKYSKVYEKAR